MTIASFSFGAEREPPGKLTNIQIVPCVAAMPPAISLGVGRSWTACWAAILLEAAIEPSVELRENDRLLHLLLPSPVLSLRNRRPGF